MSKCHVRELNQVYAAIFKDAASAYPTLQAEFEKDLARLLSLVTHRGIAVFLLDLPAAGKHLDRCLDSGEYKLSGLPLTKRYSNRVVIPKFLRGLYLLVFHETGALKVDYDIQAIIFLRQIFLAAKKTQITCSDQKIEDEVLKFQDIDSSLPEPDRVWVTTHPTEAQFQETYHGFSKSPVYGPRVGHPSSGAAPDGLPSVLRPKQDSPQWEGALSVYLGVLDRVSSILTSEIGSYDPDLWTFRHGPGAVSEEAGHPDKYNLLRTTWSDLLDERYPISSYGFHNFGSWASDYGSGKCGSGIRNDAYSRLVAVPKDYSKPRLIAAEPSSHQWCQQNVWHFLRSRVGGGWISRSVRFRDQSRNQALCRAGSISGAFTTVDLSSASDRVTCHAVGQFFRKNPFFLSCLAACRTRRVQQKLTSKVPEFIELRKFSTMGSACTFPIESLMFFGIALACVLQVRGLAPTLRNMRKMSRKVSVFGDDIIVPSDCRELLFKALEVLDFKVNTQKSYWTGRFRESCGVDSFAGVDVTPAYWKGLNDGKPESLAMTVECSNNFYRKYMLHTSRYIASTLPQVIPMVPMRSGAFGLKTRTSEFQNSLRGRWNTQLQRAEVRVGTILSVQNRLPLTISESALLQYFTEAPSPYDVWKSGVAQRPLLKFRQRWVANTELSVQVAP